MSEVFSKVKGNLGFGLMRLPMDGDNVDYKETCAMADAFLDAGFNYFDTAHGYIGGKSEIAFKDCIAKRYPRDKYIIADKLSGWNFETEEEIIPLFESQLEACGVEYFDYYLMHSQTAKYFEKYKKCHAYEKVFDLKEQGKISHVGISFHDSADVLDAILTEYPQIEFVQIQFNYADFDDSVVQSKKCYDVCRAHGKPVIVMEPVKGGKLVNLPDEASRIFAEAGNLSNAGYAIKFAASFEGVEMVLSGMSNMAQMEDNISFMKDFVPLTDEESKAVEKVREVFRNLRLIQCTECRYCVSECPSGIPIPDVFTDMNAKAVFNDWAAKGNYKKHTTDKGKASDCIGCGACEAVCPQKLSIRELLTKVADTFEKEE